MEMRYPAGNPRGKELFSALEERMQKEQYDDEFLLLLIEYREMYPESEHFDIFYGRYAFFYGNYKVALEHAWAAYQKRKTCFETWKLLVACYLALGEVEKSIPFQGYLSKFTEETIHISLPSNKIPQALGELSVMKGEAVYAPLCKKKCFLEEGQFKVEEGVFAGEMIPFSMDNEGYGYWVGAFNEAGYLGGRGKLLQEMAGKDAFMQSAGADFVYDIMRARKETEFFVDPRDGEVILPVAGAVDNQMMNFQENGIEDSAVTGQWEYDFFRVDRPVRVSSKYPLLLGKPVRLGHNEARRKFVLNILVDALSWPLLCQQTFQYMPHMMEFFSEGVVFGQHFSVAEYTYPSLASIETGMYPHHSQIYHDGLVIQLDKEYVTLSEQMKNLGYYSVSVMNTGGGLYNGVTRGYDRLLVGAYDLPAYSAVERTIRQLEAFSECDQFLFLHLLELHPWSSRTNHLDVGVQTKLCLQDRMNGREETKPSAYLPSSNLYQRAYRQAMARIDRSLGVLFDYIASHYDEDEYIIQLYSDHGASVYDDVSQLVGDNHTHSAYMLRGYGVPRKGIVDELTSAVDIYPVLGRLAGFPVGSWVDGNLPAVFGGEERTCVYSNSRYPGQTYKLCIRTKTHEFYMESLAPVHEDGTVDLSGAAASVYSRDGSHRLVEDPALADEFLEMAREYTRSFNDEGRHWHSYR